MAGILVNDEEKRIVIGRDKLVRELSNGLYLLEITVEKRVSSDFFSPLFELEYKIIVFEI